MSIDHLLENGEAIRLRGRPKQGLLLRSVDLIAIPISIFWCYFSFPLLFNVFSGIIAAGSIEIGKLIFALM